MRKALAFEYIPPINDGTAPTGSRVHASYCPVSARDPAEHREYREDVRAHEIPAPLDPPPGIQDHRPQPAPRRHGLLVLAGRARAHRMEGVPRERRGAQAPLAFHDARRA